MAGVVLRSDSAQRGDVVVQGIHGLPHTCTIYTCCLSRYQNHLEARGSPAGRQPSDRRRPASVCPYDGPHSPAEKVDRTGVAPRAGAALSRVARSRRRVGVGAGLSTGQCPGLPGVGVLGGKGAPRKRGVGRHQVCPGEPPGRVWRGLARQIPAAGQRPCRRSTASRTWRQMPSRRPGLSLSSR